MKITDDLRIKFTNDKILFEPNKTYLTQEFKNILDQFIPSYLGIINKSEYI
jgi:outer membrane protein OmpA-like peptidoglycan-associated protein